MKKLAIIGALVALAATTAVAFVPSDPNFNQQTALGLLKMQQAWGFEKGCPEAPATPCLTKVGIAGSGYGYPPPIADVPVTAVMDFTGSSNTWDEAGGTYGVSTSTAAILGGDTDNALLNAGIMDYPQTYIAKTMDLGNQQLDSELAAGVNWLVAQGVQVIQVDGPPLGDTAQPLSLIAINAAVFAKIVVVLPENGSTASQKSWLATNVDPKVVFTASTSVAGTPSTYDATWDVLDIAAPGESVYTIVSGGCCANRTASHIAAAHVTGIIALMRDRGIGESNVRRVIPLLRSPSTWDNERGWGVADAKCLFVLAGDMNDNRNVDTTDAVIIIGLFGQPGGDVKYDINNDGAIDLKDALISLAMFGGAC